MGSSASNEQESNASSTRLQSGSSERGLNEDLDRVERETQAKAVNIITGVMENQLADVQLVCQHAPEKVNDKDEVLFLVVTHLLSILIVCVVG